MKRRCFRWPAVLLLLGWAIFCGARPTRGVEPQRALSEPRPATLAPGLAGVYFNEDDFRRPEPGADLLLEINHDWGRERGADWSARWGGFLTGPCDGEVLFTAEAADGLRLRINNVVVIDGLAENGPRSGRVAMKRGEQAPLLLEFASGHGRAKLRLYWQWKGQARTLVPRAALRHDPNRSLAELRVEGDRMPRFTPPPLGADAIDLSNAVIVASLDATRHAKAADMLHDEIMKRTRIRLPVQPSMPDDATPAIVLGDADTLPVERPSPPAGAEVPARPEGYSIWVDTTARPAPTIFLIGRDDRGALYAAGKLLRLLSMRRDVLALSASARAATAPDCPLRGHQMGFRPKTNSYDGWTAEMWEQYFRDMIVYGMNAVELIPPRSDDDLDSPHFPLPPMEMMIEMSRLADQYDLDVWIWYPAIDDDYTDPATVAFALNERREVFSRLPRIDALFVPGGDPGDTHPAVLMPFIEKQKALLNRYHPKAEAWVSPQGFDRPGRNRDGWLKAFLDILQKDRPAWLDGVVFGPQVEMSLPNLRKETPAQYRIRRYPDITHCRSSQYEIPNWDDALRGTLGREPINPRPRAYAKIYRDLRPYAFGFITYSEGCNDDVNKIVWSSLGWDPNAPVEEILTDYSRYFISERYAKPFAQGLLALERNWQGPLLENGSVFDTLKLFQQMEADAAPQELLNWRFQQALYRAYYDAYIRRRLIYETELEQEALEVLKTADRIGSLEAMSKAEAILDKAVTAPVAADWRARVFELAEALFQSIRMQKSVGKYKAIRVNRGANLDEIDKPLNNAPDLKNAFEHVRKLSSETERLNAISDIVN